MKKGLFYLLIIVFTFYSLSAGPTEIMQEGEYLKYEVSFIGIGLGTIEMTTLKETDLNGEAVYNVKADIKTYDGIPFIDLKAVFHSWIDKTLNYSHKFTSNSKKNDNSWQFQQMLFNYDQNEIDFKVWENKELVEDKKIEIDKKFNDGSSLFYLARRYTNLKKSIKIPTIINAEKVETKINFHGRKESVSVGAIDYPVKTLFFDGKANWEGLYGLSGNFEGWFSDDEASVPILAKMNVYVGKVKIELVEWKRKGWTPPKGE